MGNPADDYAISVHEDNTAYTKRAYVMAEYAKTLQDVLLKNPPVLTDAYVIINEAAVVKRHEKGPEHASTLYLDVGSSEVNCHLVQNYLQAQGVTFFIYCT